ncbi:26S proteasome non-ATPase regulatory subunit 3 [Pelomyxa schiedti]|nr:26S proteasome non-ATPase regulatory subunit 3 [Pelomyxa schiedti]
MATTTTPTTPAAIPATTTSSSSGSDNNTPPPVTSGVDGAAQPTATATATATATSTVAQGTSATASTSTSTSTTTGEGEEDVDYSDESWGWFEDGVRAVFGQWTGMSLCIDNRWGGRNTQQRCDRLIEDVLDMFWNNERVYHDELEDIFYDFFDTMSVSLEDNSIEQVSLELEKLCNECLRGDFSRVIKLTTPKYTHNSAKRSIKFKPPTPETAEALNGDDAAESSSSEEPSTTTATQPETTSTSTTPTTENTVSSSITPSTSADTPASDSKPSPTKSNNKKKIRVGDLAAFRLAVDSRKAEFEADGTYSLILRLRHNVIKAGLRKVCMSYSRISLSDVAAKLHLDSVQDCEFIVAKAIRDGVIDATIDHEGGFIQSKENLDIYSTQEPRNAFHQRITFCLNIHNEAVKAMRFAPDAHKPKPLQTTSDSRAPEIDDDDDDF